MANRTDGVNAVKQALIIGCGYTGMRLAAGLQQMGFRITGTARSEKRLLGMRNAGIDPVSGSLEAAETLEQFYQLDPELVAYFVPPQKREQDPLAAVLGALSNSSLEAFLYASSTSVYGDHAGKWVDETTPVTPDNPHDAARAAAERLVANAAQSVGMPTRICRITGIYGPGRTLRRPLASGAYTLVKDHDTWVARIHVDDLVAGLIAAWQRGADGQVYNLVDQRPHRASEFSCLAADLNGLPRPKWIDEDEARNCYEPRALQRKLANKRVRCARLVEDLGVQLKFPSFEVGLPAAVAAQHSGDH